MSADAFDVDRLRDWIVGQGLTGLDLVALVAGIGDHLLAAGLPLMRAHMSFPTLDPIKRGENIAWVRGKGVVSQALDHERFEAAFQASPFPEMLRTGVNDRRWRLRRLEDAEGFPAIVECFEAGGTDYLVQLTAFGGNPGGALMGVAISAATDAPDGFSDAEIAAWNGLVPTMALAAYRIALSGVIGRVLGAYIGQDAGAHVLDGQIRRGTGHRVTAALMFADLRGFTAATAASGAEMIPLLGEHLAAMAEPVEEAGGEVLKFLGDGLLAAFAVIGENHADACASALAAARDALARNKAVNAAHGDQTLALDVALHLGEVFYGNIGAGSRLDFTVIGAAVNEASRLEGLCDRLGPILMSGAFAAHCGQPVVSLGQHELRGVGSREVFGLPEMSSPMDFPERPKPS